MDLRKLEETMKKIKQTQKDIPELLPINDIDIDEIDIDDIYDYKNPKNPLEGTYLESKESIIELYKLFIFYGLLDSFFPHYNRGC